MVRIIGSRFCMLIACVTLSGIGCQARKTVGLHGTINATSTPIMPRYSIERIGWREDGVPDTIRINDKGFVVYNGLAKPGRQVGIVWSHTKRTVLFPRQLPSMVLTGINNLGLVVGYETSDTSTITGRSVAFVWRNGRIQYLPSLLESGISQALGVNDRGIVVGDSEVSRDIPVAVKWQENSVFPLISDREHISKADRISNIDSVIVRSNLSYSEDPAGDAYLWQNGKIRRLPFVVVCLATSGEIVGIDQPDGHDDYDVVHLSRRGVLVSQAPMLDWQYEYLWGNDKNVMVGAMSSNAEEDKIRTKYRSRSGTLPMNIVIDPPSYAFVEINGQVSNLNDHVENGAGWKLESAQCVNSQGEIVGYGRYDGKGAWFLLKPAIAHH